MLVLSRKVNEAVRIDKDIEIKVLSVQGNTVRLGIQAPAYIPIHREETLYPSKHNQVRQPSNSLIELNSLNHTTILH